MEGDHQILGDASRPGEMSPGPSLFVLASGARTPSLYSEKDHHCYLHHHLLDLIFPFILVLGHPFFEF